MNADKSRLIQLLKDLDSRDKRIMSHSQETLSQMDDTTAALLVELFEAERPAQRRRKLILVALSSICLMVGILAFDPSLSMPRTSLVRPVAIVLCEMLLLAGAIGLLNFLLRPAIPTHLQNWIVIV